MSKVTQVVRGRVRTVKDEGLKIFPCGKGRGIKTEEREPSTYRMFRAVRGNNMCPTPTTTAL